MAIEGDLSNLALGDIFQTLGMARQTGTLVVKGAGERRIAFSTKGIGLMSAATSHGLRIGEYLKGREKVTPEELRTALTHQRKERDKLLGEVLLEDGACTEEDIQEAARYLAAEELYTVLTWTEGTFEFIDGEPESAGPFAGIWFDVSSVIMESARRSDELSLLVQRAPPDEVFVHDGESEGEEGLSREDYSADVCRLHDLLDGTRTAGRAFEELYLGQYDMWKALTSLLDAGLARPAESNELLQSAAGLMAKKDHKLAVDLYSRVLVHEPDLDDARVSLAECLAALEERKEAAEQLVLAGLARLERGQAEAAVDALQSAAGLDSKNAEAEEGLMRALHASGQTQQAVEAAKEAANRFVNLKEYDGAIRVAEQAIEYAPDELNLWVTLASAHHGAKRKAEAVSVLERACEHFEAQGKGEDKLVEIYKHIVRIDPERKDVAAKIGQVERRREERKKAIIRMSSIVGGILLITLGATFALSGKTFHERIQEVYALKDADDADGARGLLQKMRDEYTDPEEVLELDTATLYVDPPKGMDMRGGGKHPALGRLEPKVQAVYDTATEQLEAGEILPSLETLLGLPDFLAADEHAQELIRANKKVHVDEILRTWAADELAGHFLSEIGLALTAVSNQIADLQVALRSDDPYKAGSDEKVRLLRILVDRADAAKAESDRQDWPAVEMAIGKIREALPEDLRSEADKVLEILETVRSMQAKSEELSLKARIEVEGANLKTAFYKAIRSGDALIAEGRLDEAVQGYKNFIARCDEMRRGTPWTLYEPLVKKYIEDAPGSLKYPHQVSEKVDLLNSALSIEMEAANAESAGNLEMAYDLRVQLWKDERFVTVGWANRLNLPVMVETLPAGARVSVVDKDGNESGGNESPTIVHVNIAGGDRIVVRADGFTEASSPHTGVDDPIGHLRYVELRKAVAWEAGPQAMTELPAVAAGENVLLMSRRGVLRMVSTVDGSEIRRFEPMVEEEYVEDEVKKTRRRPALLEGVVVPPIVRGDRIHIITLDGACYVLDLELAQKATYRIAAKVRVAAVSVPRGVVTVDDRGTARLVDDTGTEIWSVNVGGASGDPAVWNDTVVVPGIDGELILLDSTRGSIAARIKLPGSPPWAPAAIHGDTAYTGAAASTEDEDGNVTFRGRVVAVDLVGRKVTWHSDLDHAVQGRAACDGEQILVGTTRGGLYALAPADGGPRWGPVGTGGSIRDGLLAVPGGFLAHVPMGRSDDMARISAKGEILWRFQLEGRVAARPSLLGEYVVIVLQDGSAIAIRP